MFLLLVSTLFFCKNHVNWSQGLIVLKFHFVLNALIPGLQLRYLRGMDADLKTWACIYATYAGGGADLKTQVGF